MMNLEEELQKSLKYYTNGQPELTTFMKTLRTVSNRHHVRQSGGPIKIPFPHMLPQLLVRSSRRRTSTARRTIYLRQ